MRVSGALPHPEPMPPWAKDAGKALPFMIRGSSHCRRALLASIPSTLVAAGVLFSVATGAGPMGGSEAPQGLLECGPSEISLLPEGTDAKTIYAIVPEEPTARYRAQEELAQVGQNEAVGETQAIAGQIGFDAEGKPVPCSRIDVDLRTLKSDQAWRDNYLYKNTLETETYPLATFVLREVQGLNGPLAEGKEVPLTLIGDLTMHGVTKTVAWQGKAMLQGDTPTGEIMTGEAVTEFDMPDFAIEPPRVPVVLSLNERVRLEIDLTATKVMGEGAVG